MFKILVFIVPVCTFSVKNQGKWVQHFIDNMVEVRMDVCTASEPACQQKLVVPIKFAMNVKFRMAGMKF